MPEGESELQPECDVQMKPPLVPVGSPPRLCLLLHVRVPVDDAPRLCLSLTVLADARDSRLAIQSLVQLQPPPGPDP